MTLILWFGVFLIQPASTARAEEEIYLASGEWPPFISEGLPRYGLASDIVSQAFAKTGVKVVYGFFPWARAESLAKNDDNKWVGSLIWLYREHRARDFRYSAPVMTERHKLFHRGTEISFSADGARHHTVPRVGILIGASYPSFVALDQAGIVKLQYAPTTTQLFQMLSRGRIDAVPIAETIGRYHVARLEAEAGKPPIMEAEMKLPPQEYRVIFSRLYPGSEELVARFNAGLETLRRSGEYDALVSYHFKAVINQPLNSKVRSDPAEPVGR